MKRIYFSFTGIILLYVLSFCGSKAAKKEKEPVTAKGFAVVELFTSEGCSSCPPADEVMIKLAGEFPEHVYFLGYHVDYWDYTGWKDAFSNADYTKRQDKYAAIFGLSSIYTPQAIVNGEKELVGSKENQLRTIIREKLDVEPSSLIELSAKKGETTTISVSYKVTNGKNAVLNIALVQLAASTDVKRGENNGRKLNHINIVRDLQTILLNKNADSKIDFPIPQGLTAKDLKVIAFVQNEKDMKITGAFETEIQ